MHIKDILDKRNFLPDMVFVSSEIKKTNRNFKHNLKALNTKMMERSKPF